MLKGRNPHKEGPERRHHEEGPTRKVPQRNYRMKEGTKMKEPARRYPIEADEIVKTSKVKRL